MGTRTLHSDSNPRRKRSFTLSSFRKPAGDQQSVVTAAEERARIRKAAAWQWYTRGVGEVVAPTKRPIPGGTLAGGAGAVGGLVQPKGGEENSIEKKCSAAKDQPPAAVSRRAASRFKVEASAARDSPEGAPVTNIPAGPSRPLYDEFELAGLRAQMVDFVQHLQKKEYEQKVTKPLNSDPTPAVPAGSHSSRQHMHPPAEGSGVRKSNSASVEGPGFRRPMSALQKLLRKVRTISSFSKNNSAALQEPEALPDEPEPDDVQYHYHHYIHHHHHHYHYGGSSPEEAEFIRRRRNSESSGIRPRIPSSIWEENETTTEEEEKSSLGAFISRRRRHSDSVFTEQNAMKKSNYEGAEWPVKEPLKPAEPQLSMRRYNSELFTSEKKVPNVGKDVEFGEQWQGADLKSRRRRHSMESFREGEVENVRWRMGAATEEARAKGGGGDGGGVYKLGGARVYEGTRRRNSESLGITSSRREENVDLMYGGRGSEYDIATPASTRCWQGPRWSRAQPARP